MQLTLCRLSGEESERLTQEKSAVDAELQQVQQEEDTISVVIEHEAADHFAEKRRLETQQEELHERIQPLLKQVAALQEEAKCCTTQIQQCEEVIEKVRARHHNELTPLSSKRIELVEVKLKSIEKQQDKLSQDVQDAEREVQQYSGAILATQNESEHVDLELEKATAKLRLHQRKARLEEDYFNLRAGVLASHTRCLAIISQMEKVEREKEEKMCSVNQQMECENNTIARMRAAIDERDAELSSLEESKRASATVKDFKSAARYANDIKLRREEKEKQQAELNTHTDLISELASLLDSAKHEYQAVIEQKQQNIRDFDLELIEHRGAQTSLLQAMITCAHLLEDRADEAALQVRLAACRADFQKRCGTTLGDGLSLPPTATAADLASMDEEERVLASEAQLRKRLRDLEQRVDACAAAEDYENADQLQQEQQQVAAELEALASTASHNG
eukprot:TRINITY_DN1569_c0_g1_i4.p1 TRINITY_DN1569_c0_g1~~TRINITY_DN1569_c0_g1_i4.p1  ORF type:complete len:450 (+),score=141.63 TRINITY_DN1569_c0_g1_i4:890-2239(+)